VNGRTEVRLKTITPTGFPSRSSGTPSIVRVPPTLAPIPSRSRCRRDFGFQRRSRLEEVAQHTDEQEANRNHSAITF
jgi:hypothetical protein